jgi:hypothetical protein
VVLSALLTVEGLSTDSLVFQAQKRYLCRPLVRFMHPPQVLQALQTATGGHRLALLQDVVAATERGPCLGTVGTEWRWPVTYRRVHVNV